MGSLPYPTPTLLGNGDWKPDYSRSDGEIDWPAPEALCGDSLFPDTYIIPASHSFDRYNSSYLEPDNIIDPYSEHIGSETIIAFENRGFSTAEVKVDVSRGDRNTFVPFSLFDSSSPLSSDSLGSSLGLSKSVSGRQKSCRRSRSSSTSEPPYSKKRQSSSRRPVHVSSTDVRSESKPKSTDFQCPKPRKSLDSLDREHAVLESDIKPKATAKSSHSLIERRYRENLNSRIVLLGQALATTRKPRNDTDAGNKPTASKSRKADVLNEAVLYVQRAELESDAHVKEIELLKTKVAALERNAGNRDSISTTQLTGTEMSLHRKV